MSPHHGKADRPLRVAVLVKQIPRFETMDLGPDGRLRREGLPLEMNAYCRRAVAKGVELVRDSGGRCTVVTLGPPSAEDVLREAVAWGADDGILVTDPAFAGSDTLATARALAAVLTREGPYDLVLTGRNSVDADTGQVAPEIAHLLDLPLAAAVRQLELHDGLLSLRCEHDDGRLSLEVRLPAVVSVAERLTEPCKVDEDGRRAVAPERIRRISATDLGPGPWGLAGSATRVDGVRVLDTARERRRLSGTTAGQVSRALDILHERCALRADAPRKAVGRVAEPARARTATRRADAAVLVVAEPGRPRQARELLGAAAGLAAAMDHGGVAVLTVDPLDAVVAATWGADAVVRMVGSAVEEDVARALIDTVRRGPVAAVLVPGTLWGREVAARAAAQLGAGLTGDAVELEVVGGRLVCWKPAFGGRLVAAVHAQSDLHMVTVRPGVLPLLEPRAAGPRAVEETISLTPRGRVHVLARTRDDELDALTVADTIVGVGTGVGADEYPLLRPLLGALGAELAATRRVTDRGWQPRSRQVGITGRTVAPRLYVAIGLSGKFNHMVAVRSAGTILAVNADPHAPVFDAADVGIVADWHEVVPLLTRALVEGGGGVPSTSSSESAG